MCAAWLGAGGEESVNPAFLGRSQLLAVRRRMPGWERSALGGSSGGMRGGVDISCCGPGAGRETAAISTLPLMCCPQPAREPKPASNSSPRSGTGQAREAARIPACLQCGQAGYRQLPDPRLIQHWQAAREWIPGIPQHWCAVRAPQGADAGG